MCKSCRVTFARLCHSDSCPSGLSSYVPTCTRLASCQFAGKLVMTTCGYRVLQALYMASDVAQTSADHASRHKGELPLIGPRGQSQNELFQSLQHAECSQQFALTHREAVIIGASSLAHLRLPIQGSHNPQGVCRWCGPMQQSWHNSDQVSLLRSLLHCLQDQLIGAESSARVSL